MGRDRWRGGGRESPADSVLSAEPDSGLDLTLSGNQELDTQLTEPARWPHFIFICDDGQLWDLSVWTHIFIIWGIFLFHYLLPLLFSVHFFYNTHY